MRLTPPYISARAINLINSNVLISSNWHEWDNLNLGTIIRFLIKRNFAFSFKSRFVSTYHIFCPIVEHLQLKSLSFPDVLNIYKGGRHYICSYCERERKASEMYFTLFTHSSLVDYLAQVKNWKKWTQPFRLCFELGMGAYVHHTEY